MNKRIWIMALVAGLFTGAANATIYDCKMVPQGRNQDLIAPTITITINDSNNRVLVTDELIRKYSVRQVLGELSIDNAKRVTLKWELTGVRDRRGHNLGRMMYRATILKANNRISVTALPSESYLDISGGGGGNTSRSARGKCVLRK